MGKGWKTPSKIAKAQKKGAAFTKISREIAVAAKFGGPDPQMNSRLALAVQSAKSVSCPKDTIERAIKKGAGIGDDSVQIDECVYEGYAPHQVGVIIECQTDNKNRTITSMRTLFKKSGSALGESGSVAWMFDHVSLVECYKEGKFDPEEEAIEAGANEVEKNELDEESDSKLHTYSFYGELADLDTIRKGLIERGWQITVAELSYKPKNITELSDEQKNDVHEFLAKLDDDEDSHRVYATL